MSAAGIPLEKLTHQTLVPPSPHGEKQLGWGLLSTARINEGLIPHIHASGRSTLVAVASRDGQKAKSYAKTHNIPRSYGTYEDMLNDPDIDIIYNSLPNHLHAEWSIKAVEAGKHVLCEKPIALSVAELEAMQKASLQHNRVITEAYMYRSHPQTHYALDLIRSGIVGRPQLMRGSFGFTLINAKDYRWDPSLGGGSLWDIGCYPLGMSRLLAKGEVREVFGMHNRTRTGIDASFFAQIRFASGEVAQFDCSFASQPRRSFTLIGEHGELSLIEPFNPGEVFHIVVKKGGVDQEEHFRGSSKPSYRCEIEDMENACLGLAPPRISLQDSLIQTRTILALYESARTGTPVIL